MGRYSKAALCLSSAAVFQSVQCFCPSSFSHRQPTFFHDMLTSKQRTFGGVISATVYSSYDPNDFNGEDWKTNMIDAIPNPLADDEADEEEFEASNTPKSLQRLAANSYTVDLPIGDLSEDMLGLSLRQVGKGNQISDLALDVDSLLLVESSDMNTIKNTKNNENNEQMLDKAAWTNLFENEVGPNFEGVVVSKIIENGLAWNAGVRIGDVLIATSATMGDKLWPKTTLEGVRSAFRSRKVMSSSMALQFRRSRAYLDASEVVEKFELTLSRPMGIHVADQEDGSIRITGFTDEAMNTIVTDSLRVGDRIVAADSTVGDKLWPVSNVEGLVSAVTTRLPGKPVRLQFERSVNVGEFKANPNTQLQSTATASDETKSSLVGAADGFRKVKEASVTAEAKGAPVSIQSTGSNTHKLLLSRSRDLLRRYINNQNSYDLPKSALSSVPAVVADRILETLADAAAPLDSKTLSLAMNAYISCRKPNKAINVFEAAIGIAADGSAAIPDISIKGKREGRFLICDRSSLDLSTGTALLRAHALNGNYPAAQRVLAAMKGNTDTIIKSVTSISWQMNEKPDTRCYNIILSAAAKAGGKRAINAAIDLFENMQSPTKTSRENQSSGIATKDRVTYNTMIGAFAKEKRTQDALTIFYDMKQFGIKPDKFTYTSLLKALVENGDIDGGQELMQEMKEMGVEADVVTYNTMIKALCDRLQWFRAKQLVTEMEVSGVNPNSITYGLLMNGLLKADKPGACLTLFEAACADERTAPIMENVQLYTTAITAASRQGNYERAVDLVSRMKKAGVKPNLKTLTALMSACLTANQPQYALNVYAQAMKIANEPETFEIDGFIMSLAFKAYCTIGDFSSASKMLTEQKDGYREMSGKDIMYSYNFLIEAALKSNEYEVARAALTELLQSGYIPSKTTFQNIVNACNIEMSPKKKIFNTISNTVDEDKELNKLKFVLFVLDSLTKRNLPIDGSFYSAVLTEGVRIGGLGRKIASLLGKARANTREIEGTMSLAEGETELEPPTWENMLIQFESGIDEGKKKNVNLNLPVLKVRVGKREARQVMIAESPVVYKLRQRQARKFSSR